jgi:ferrous iron transport protein A
MKTVFNFDRNSNAALAGLSTRASEPLTALEPGQRARIEAVELEGPAGTRLRDLGFLPGTEVSLVRRAPLGDPAVYELRGAQICLRRTEAQAIHVVLLPS